MFIKQSNLIWYTNYSSIVNEMIKILRPYVIVQTKHLCHEIYSFDSNSNDLQTYDRNMKYSRRDQ